MEDYLQVHKDLAETLQPLYNRQDIDKDLFYQRPFVMRDSVSGLPIKDVYNVTFNDAAVFGHRTISLLSAVNETIVVSGKGMTDADTSYIEQFLYAAFWEADQRLIRRGEPTLKQSNSQYSSLRGRLATRVLVRIEGGKLLIDILPWDARHVTYKFGTKGLAQIGYETTRSKADIKAEYNKDISGKEETVVDIYTQDKHLLYIGTEEVKDEKHECDETPCIYTIVSAGSMLKDSDSLGHQGESIYALNRHIYPEINEMASVLKTQNMQGFMAGLEYASLLGAEGNVDFEENPRAPGAITAVETGGGFRPIPTNDMKNATRQYISLLQTRAQWGSVSSIDYGNLTFPLSAVAIARLKESKDQIFWPRLDTMAIHKRALARQIIRQYIKKNKPTVMGEEGKAIKFDPAKLDKDYTIEFKYFAQTPEEEMANTAHATQQLAMGLPKHYVYTHTMNFENPTEVLMQGVAEEAEELSPDIKLRRHMVSLYMQDTPDGNTEADMLWPVLERMLKQKMNPQPVEQEPQKKKKPSSVGGGLPLLEGGSGGGRRQLGRDQLEASEEAMVTEQENAQSNAINRERRGNE
uniref:Portal protein n=1 Tax=viral metagenome TaxID=1070528 RepID=A0A6M3KWX3_9ZZZZ